MTIFFRTCLIFLCLSTSVLAAPKVQIQHIEVFQTKNQTRLLFDLSGPLQEYHAFNLKNPDRFVIDITNANFNVRAARQVFLNTVIEDIRSGQRENNTLRIVFDLVDPAKTKASMLKPNRTHGYRLMLELSPLKITPRIPPRVATKPIYTATPHVSLSSQPITRDLIVVIDPGHGGKDPGATGPHQVREKNVVLEISKQLAKALNAKPGIRAYLTRSGNYYLTLRQRLNVARKYRADLFVAIHADAVRNAHAEGATVFALSEKGASSEMARWLAEKENYSELGETNLNGKDNMLRSVLIDLSQTATISASLQLGAMILRQLDTVTSLHHPRVEQARFVVLKSPDILSLLIETGFITNPIEERRLCSTYYQHQLALAIANGIAHYFETNPIPGTLFATQHYAKTYVARAGDTVDSLAKKFRTSSALLKKLNHLASNRLFLGQHVLIP